MMPLRYAKSEGILTIPDNAACMKDSVKQARLREKADKEDEER